MAKLVAIEWDAREARVVVARGRGDAFVEHAFSVDLDPPSESMEMTPTSIGERIGAALSARNVGRGEAIVAVGRVSIELRQLTLPPSPIEELPDLVRFQALRQFTTIGEDWPLDFVHVDTGDAESFSVLAAAIAPTMVEQIRETCKSAELAPKRLVLRPFAAASLWRRRSRDDTQAPMLMVDLLADEADLTVLVERQVVMMRTVRVSSGDAESAAEALALKARALLSEIRRTIAAAQNQLGGRRAEKVVLCGDGNDQDTLKKLLETQLSLEVELFDPFDGVKLGRELRRQRPVHRGRFAPLIGMVIDEAADAAHAIDFLSPRKRPEAPSHTRRNVLIGATALSAVLAAGTILLGSLWSLDDQVATLRAESNRLATQVETESKHVEDLQELQTFLRNDLNWLNELYELSRELPSAEEVVITQLTAGNRNQGGQITLDGYARSNEMLTELQAALRRDGRQVISTGSQDDLRRETYRWRFKETILIEPGPVPPITAAPPADRAGQRTGDAPAHQEQRAEERPPKAPPETSTPPETPAPDRSNTAAVAPQAEEETP